MTIKLSAREEYDRLVLTISDDGQAMEDRDETRLGFGTASDGDSALRLSDKLNPDLLLLDMTMPGKDGLQVASEAGKMENPPAVIFVTAHEDFAVEAFDLEAVDYVLKPVATERLERAIERALSRKNQAAEEGQPDDRWHGRKAGSGEVHPHPSLRHPAQGFHNRPET